MRRRFAFAALAIVGLLAAGYTAWWYVLARRVESGFAAWAAARRAEGWTVEVGASHVGGWPLASRLDLADLQVRGGAPELPFAFVWNAAGLALQVAPLDPAALVILARGAQRIGTPSGATLILTGGALSGRLHLTTAGPPWALEVKATSLHVRPSSTGGDAVVARLSAQVTLDPAASTAGTALGVVLQASHIELPSGRRWPLGEQIAMLDADTVITGPVPPPGEPALRAHAWREAGGTAMLRGGAIRWGPLDASATGHGGLDADLQPTAEGTARVTGWAQALDILAAHDVISDHAALTAKAVVSLLAETPPGGGASVLTIPFAARGGVLSVRQIPLLRLPALAWPGG